MQGIQTHDKSERAVRVRNHCCRREGESTKYQRFRYHDVTGVAMVPHIIKKLHGQWCPMELHVESYAHSL